jgi:long-chain acyl-CoA synthetase
VVALVWNGSRRPPLSQANAVRAVAATGPRAVAWDFMDTTETYEQFLRSIDVCADGLAGLGIKAADRVVIAMPTSPQGVIGFYAANKLGAVVAFVHPLASAPELEHYLNATGARIVLTLDSLYERFACLRRAARTETRSCSPSTGRSRSFTRSGLCR